MVSRCSKSIRRLRNKYVKYFNLVVFEWEAIRYIIGVDFYIVTLRLISFTDSNTTIIYLLLKQDLDHSVQSLRERCSLRNRHDTFRT